jgi:hypothetical protein
MWRATIVSVRGSMSTSEIRPTSPSSVRIARSACWRTYSRTGGLRTATATSSGINTANANALSTQRHLERRFLRTSVT